MRNRSMQAGVAALVLMLVGLALVPVHGGTGETPTHPQLDSDGACVFEPVPPLGPACRLDDGLWKIRHRDGSYGYTHGPDPLLPHEQSDGPGGLGHGGLRPPVCATVPESDYHHVLIYARAHDDEDRYATVAPELKDLVHEINGHLDEEAKLSGAVSADYRFRCVGSELVVYDEALPTSKFQADFNTITSDLMDAGYDNQRAKYWVWYDDQDACSCAGIGHVYDDDRLEEDNFNNGHPDAVPMFGVTFGHLGDQGFVTMMHENGHNMGAVQLSAGNASPGGFHCNDGQDIMCYDDSGGGPSQYDPDVCSGYKRFDCDKNDYFHAHPAQGSYLDTHWNVATQLNRFLVIELGVPQMQELDCTPTPSGTGQGVTCTFHATADGADEVHYDVDWGDGASTRVPATGTVPAGQTQSADHTWDDEGDFNVKVTATDDRDPPLTSQPIVFLHEVLVNEPVAVATADPQRGNIGTTFTFDGSDSHRPDGTIEAYEWSRDGEVVSEEAVHSTQFTLTGEHCLTLVVTDDHDASDSDTACVWVNNPPEASAEASQAIVVTGDDVTFDGTGSTDPDGSIVAYEWRLDGEVVSTQSVHTTEFSTPGEPCLVLEVTDDDGATDSDAACVEVIDPPQPVAVADADPLVQNLGHDVTFNGSSSDDQDPTGSGIVYEWTDDGVPVSSQETFATQFIDVGGHCLKLTVTNPWDVSDDDETCVEIVDTYEVTASPTKETYVPSNQPVVDVWVKTVAGGNVDGADVDIEVHYETGNELVDDLWSGLGCVTSWSASAQTSNGFVRFTVPGAPERCAGAGLNGELVTLMDGSWQVEVHGAQFGNSGSDTASYRVSV